MQGDERSFFGALRVAGHGTGSARSGVDIRHISKTDGPTFHVIRCPHRPCTHTVQLLCSYCTAAVGGAILVQLPSEGLFPQARGRFLSFWDHGVRDLEAGRGEG